MSALTIMAAALNKELQHRGVRDFTQDACEEILRTVIDHAAAVGRAYETSHPGPMPPSIGRVTDGGCITSREASGASAVDFSGRMRPESTPELIERARELVLQKPSTSYVQRHLGIGYNHACELIEHFEAQGIISRPNSTGVRTVLFSKQE